MHVLLGMHALEWLLRLSMGQGSMEKKAAVPDWSNLHTRDAMPYGPAAFLPNSSIMVPSAPWSRSIWAMSSCPKERA